MASTWGWLGKRREKQVISYAIKHLDLIEKEANNFLEMIKAVLQEKLTEIENLYKQVFENERKADEEKKKIIDELSTEIIHPISREELIRMILTSDDIANYIKSAARRVSFLTEKRLPSDIIKYYLQMTEKIYEQIQMLKDAVTLLAEDPKQSIKLADKIEELEEEVDEIRGEAEKKIFSLCENSSPGECLLAFHILNTIENASDKCEDSGDVIRSIALLG